VRIPDYEKLILGRFPAPIPLLLDELDLELDERADVGSEQAVYEDDQAARADLRRFDLIDAGERIGPRLVRAAAQPVHEIRGPR
jgi:hypothetical protein